MQWTETWVERLRGHLTAEVRADVARLEREIESQSRSWRDPEALRTLVDAALVAQAGESPERLAAVLRPIVEDLVRQGERRQARRRRRLLAAALALAGGAGFLGWWHGAPLSIAAAPAPPPSAVTEIPLAAGPAAAIAPPAVILEERGDGFGLGHAAVSDAELAITVRDRLSRCAALADGQVSFAVKEGWVWLRGRASPGGRDAAAAVLDDLGDGVLVVNQIVGTGGEAVADTERGRDG